MNPLTQIPNLPPGRFRVGDHVRLLYAFRGLVGEIFEDRGNHGVGGRRIYAVRLQPDEWNELTTEFPEASLDPVED